MAKKLCGDMIAVYEHLSTTVKHRREYAKSWTDFMTSIQRMTLTQIPELKDGFAELASLVEQFTQIHTTLADKEERTAEDLRDVYERFEILFRAGEEVVRRRVAYGEASKALQTLEVRIKVEETRPNYDKIRYKFEKELAIAKTNKADALRRLKNALIAVIEHKRLYDSFKIRRLSHGWHLYAAALREAAEQELDVFVKIRNHLATLDNAIEGVQDAVQFLESAPTAPAPEPVPPEVIKSVTEALPEVEPETKVTEPVEAGWVQPEPVAAGWTAPQAVDPNWGGGTGSSFRDDPTPNTPLIDSGNPFDFF